MYGVGFVFVELNVRAFSFVGSLYLFVALGIAYVGFVWARAGYVLL